MSPAILAGLRAFAWPWMILLYLVFVAGLQTVRVDRLKTDLAEARKTAAEARSVVDGHKAEAASCKAALRLQTGKLEALSAEGAARLAQADKAAADARAVAASARRQAEALLSAQLIGATACERAEDVRRRFLEAQK
jgi:hypothetical protein